MKSYCIKEGYKSNLRPAAYVDSEEDALTYQVAVYRFAADLVARIGARSLLDVGCGVGLKLREYLLPRGIDICGVDLPESIAWCHQNLDFGRWLADDLEDPKIDLGNAFDVILAADVVEHLLDPDRLFAYCSRWSHAGTKLVVSTPERDLRRGLDDCGPPGNPAHVREWNGAEFERYLDAQGLAIEQSSIVELKPGFRTCQLFLCAWRSRPAEGPTGSGSPLRSNRPQKRRDS